jgi:ribosomal protein S18 acetylase RimI-like enzyme
MKMPALAVRPATAADRPHLRDAVAQLQDHERSLHPSRLPGDEIADAYLVWLFAKAEASGAILIAEDEGRFAGFVAGWIEEEANIAETPESRRFGYICDIFVLPAFRGRRIAAGLLTAMEERLKREGVQYLRLNALASNTSARKSYERVGFVLYEVMYEKRL